MRDRKASAEELKRGVFDVIAHRRAEVRESAAMGGDAAVVDCGEVLLHTDPITGRCMDIGSLAIKVVSNDVAAAGGELVAVLLTVLLPKEFSVEDLKKIMSDAEAECGKIGAEIVGGHSEFTSAVTRPVVSAMAVAKRLPGFTAIAPKAGDDIVMTKTAAMEATVLMAERAPLPLDEEELNEIAFMKENLGIIRDARVAALSTPVRMHDVTEGGIENAVYEVLSGAGVGGVLLALQFAKQNAQGAEDAKPEQQAQTGCQQQFQPEQGPPDFGSRCRGKDKPCQRTKNQARAAEKNARFRQRRSGAARA